MFTKTMKAISLLLKNIEETSCTFNYSDTNVPQKDNNYSNFKIDEVHIYKVTIIPLILKETDVILTN